jgi:nucleotide-binding universal stress UspA family protein
MHGTLVCAVTDDDASRDAIELGVELSERLGLRIVLAHAVDGIGEFGSGDGVESVSMKADRQGAERRLARLVLEHGIADRAESRVAVGEPAALLGQIAAEEEADVIVVGARTRGWRGRLESRLAEELDRETPVPVLIAPPRKRGRRTRGTSPKARR